MSDSASDAAEAAFRAYNIDLPANEADTARIDFVSGYYAALVDRGLT